MSEELTGIQNKMASLKKVCISSCETLSHWGLSDPFEASTVLCRSCTADLETLSTLKKTDGNCNASHKEPNINQAQFGHMCCSITAFDCSLTAAKVRLKQCSCQGCLCGL